MRSVHCGEREPRQPDGVGAGIRQRLDRRQRRRQALLGHEEAAPGARFDQAAGDQTLVGVDDREGARADLAREPADRGQARAGGLSWPWRTSSVRRSQICSTSGTSDSRLSSNMASAPPWRYITMTTAVATSATAMTTLNTMRARRRGEKVLQRAAEQRPDGHARNAHALHDGGHVGAAQQQAELLRQEQRRGGDRHDPGLRVQELEHGGLAEPHRAARAAGRGSRRCAAGASRGTPGTPLRPSSARSAAPASG